MARSAAAVSVVKYGLPVPAARRMMCPFPDGGWPGPRMYGSATLRISMAVITRGSSPTRWSASASASAFITVASMPM